MTTVSAIRMTISARWDVQQTDAQQAQTWPCDVCGAPTRASWCDACREAVYELGRRGVGVEDAERILRARLADEARAVKLVARCEAGLCDVCKAREMCAEDAERAREWAADWADQSQPWMA